MEHRFGSSTVDFTAEIRRIIGSGESLNARYRRATRARGHFLTGQAALKCFYLVTRSLDPTGRVRARWKPDLNAFAIIFERCFVASTTN